MKLYKLDLKVEQTWIHTVNIIMYWRIDLDKHIQNQNQSSIATDGRTFWPRRLLLTAYKTKDTAV